MDTNFQCGTLVSDMVHVFVYLPQIALSLGQVPAQQLLCSSYRVLQHHISLWNTQSQPNPHYFACTHPQPQQNRVSWRHFSTGKHTLREHEVTCVRLRAGLEGNVSYYRNMRFTCHKPAYSSKTALHPMSSECLGSESSILAKGLCD